MSTQSTLPPFHLAIPVGDIDAARAFYGDVMGSRMTERGTDFVIKPYVRFQGEPGEQWTMFFLDPSGNAMEFKAFADLDQLFAV